MTRLLTPRGLDSGQLLAGPDSVFACLDADCAKDDPEGYREARETRSRRVAIDRVAFPTMHLDLEDEAADRAARRNLRFNRY